MHCEKGKLGCSVNELYDLGTQTINKYLESSGTWDGAGVNVYTPEGLKQLIKFVKWAGQDYESGGITLFADSSTYGNGERLAKYLVEHDHHVERITEYENVGHDGKCRVWAWYHREAPKKEPVNVVDAARPVSSVRRKAVVKKTRTVARRTTGVRRRLVGANRD